MTQPSVTGNVTCLGCGCACDDIAVVVASGRIVDARNACQLGRRWFGDGQAPSAIRVDGADVTLERAVSSAAGRLFEAARPLVYLAPALSCEAQREAVALADILRARLDSVTSSTALLGTLASQEHGSASATLGELRNRADVLVFWGVDLEGRYPRFASRYAPGPPGVYVPDGRRSRTVIAVDVGQATATVDSDVRVAIDAGDELATLTALVALVRSPDAGNFASLADRPRNSARELATALLAARYTALVYDAEPDDRSERTGARFEVLVSLAQALNDRTRCAALALRAGGNRSGADSVLVAQTGYPFAIDFARGHPRYVPHGGTALDGLRGHDIDALLVVGDPTGIRSDVTASISGVETTVAIGPHASSAAWATRGVVIDTGVDGIHASGTALRTDDVPLPLRASLPGPRPTADTIRAVTSGILRALASARTTKPMVSGA